VIMDMDRGVAENMIICLPHVELTADKAGEHNGQATGV